MTFRIPERSTDLIRHVAFQDASVTCDPEGYRAYMESGDRANLKLSGEPTVFVFRHPRRYDHGLAQEAGVAIPGAGATLESALVLVGRCLVAIEPWPVELGKEGDAWYFDSTEKSRQIRPSVLADLGPGFLRDAAHMLLSRLPHLVDQDNAKKN